MPAPGEDNHIDIARAVLGAGWAGDIFATYEAMWNAGWVRVVDTPDKLYGEKLLNRRQVPFAELTPEQQVWFEEKARSEGKQLIWNDQEFANTREAQRGEGGTHTQAIKRKQGFAERNASVDEHLSNRP